MIEAKAGTRPRRRNGCHIVAEEHAVNRGPLGAAAFICFYARVQRKSLALRLHGLFKGVEVDIPRSTHWRRLNILMSYSHHHLRPEHPMFKHEISSSSHSAQRPILGSRPIYINYY